MGFLLDCPNCGRRSYTEFWFGGEAVDDLDTVDVERSYEQVWMRANVAGAQIERWYHFGGCRRWLTVTRDTTSNELTPAGSRDDR
jgi:heterotetrameric sarcosine oxidase delta subunit